VVRQCSTARTTALTVREVAQLCGVRPVAIYAAVSRGRLIAVRRVSRPIEFEVGEFAAYFNAADRRQISGPKGGA